MEWLTNEYNKMVAQYSYLVEKGQSITALYYRGRMDQLHQLIQKMEASHAK
jgi:hypothetical protein